MSTIEKATLITGTKVITARINTYSTAAKALDTEVNLLACSVLSHCIAKGEESLANKLLDSLGKSQRKDALLRWFVNFGNMSLKPATDKTKGCTNVKLAKTKETDLDAALKIPFWEYVLPPVVNEFNLVKAYYASLKSIISKTKKRIEDEANGEIDNSKNIIDHKFLAKLEKQLAAKA